MRSSTATYHDVTPSRLGLGERIERLAMSDAPASMILLRAAVGAVFLLEGGLKFLDPGGSGAGRFAKIGIPFPSFFAAFDGVFEIGCGIGLMLGLMTRLCAVPMIVNMLVAITTTKIPLLLQEGFRKAAHEARLDVAMLLSCAFLLLAGAGPFSVDAVLAGTSRHRGRAAAPPDGWHL